MHNKNSGPVAFYIAYEENYYDNLVVEAIDDETYTTRYDDMNDVFEYSAGSNVDDGNGWYFATMSSFNRTISTGKSGDSFKISSNNVIKGGHNAHLLLHYIALLSGIIVLISSNCAINFSERETASL